MLVDHNPYPMACSHMVMRSVLSFMVTTGYVQLPSLEPLRYDFSILFAVALLTALDGTFIDCVELDLALNLCFGALAEVLWDERGM